MRYAAAIVLTVPTSVLVLLMAAVSMPGSGSGATGWAIFLGIWAVLAVVATHAGDTSRVVRRASLILGAASIALPFAVWQAFGGGLFFRMSIVFAAGVGITALLLSRCRHQ